MKFSIILVVLILCQATLSHRILGIFQHTGGSHFAVFRPFLKKLAEAGHDLTVISHFPLEKPMKNYKDISLKGTLPIWKEAFTFDYVTFFKPTEMLVRHLATALILIGAGRQSCTAMMEHKEVQNLNSGQFDIVLFEDFNSDCPLALVYKLQAPSIALVTNVMFPWNQERLGIISNPAYIPTHNLDTGRHVTTWGALKSLLVNNIFSWTYYLVSRLPDEFILKKYIHDLPTFKEIEKNVSMMFVNTYFPLTGANPVPPNVLEIGGIHHEEVKELPKDIKNFLDDATEGVILFSMGSMLQASSLPPEKLKIFQKVLSELPQKVLWKWENETMPDIPKNVKIVKWIPQYDILHHKNVKAFITHAGMLGISETVKAGVPALSIPMFGDQFCNAVALEESGGGIYLQYTNISEESLKWALEIVLNPEMQDSAKKLSNLWNDRPMSVMDSALYWVDHVAKYGGSHLQPTSKELPLYRYLMLDVILVLIIISVIFMYMSRKIYLCGVGCISRTFAAKKKKD